MSPVRVEYIRESVLHERVWSFGSMRSKGMGCNPADLPSKPLQGLTALDVGCGGGLLSEPLARLGAKVTGIDPGQENLGIASSHAQLDPLLCEGEYAINYRAITAEELCDELQAEKAADPDACDNRFDIVVASEVIEHVVDQTTFVGDLARLVKPGGLVFISSINKTKKAYAFAIVGAEKVTKVVPEGTHDWENFPVPSALSSTMQQQNLQTRDVSGMVFAPQPFVRGGLSWSLHPTDIDCNFIMYAAKSGDAQ